jgi:hypothetical protein
MALLSLQPQKLVRPCLWLYSPSDDRLHSHRKGQIWLCIRRKNNIRRSVHHSTIHKEKSNRMQQRNKILLFYIYLKLNMFRTTHRPSSGA